MNLNSTITRKQALTATAVIALSSVVNYSNAAPDFHPGYKKKKGATFVLIHGAWHGGWCWKKVTPLLRSAGHDVYTPTLTGLGERNHLANPDTGLTTHIRDVVAAIEYEDLNDIILAGHSYAGMVISGVAMKSSNRIAKIIYLDAFLPADGKSLIDYVPKSVSRYEEIVKGKGDGWRLPFADALTMEALGVTDVNDVAWMSTRMTDQPFKTFTEKLQIPSEDEITKRGVYILTSDRPPFVSASKKANEKNMKTISIPGAGHDCMITEPAAVADALLAL